MLYEVITETIKNLIADRTIYPCFFGSALKLEGIEELLDGMLRYTADITYDDRFAAKIYKITRDEQGMRLTHLKITGGSLQVKDMIRHEFPDQSIDEKVDQIRIYSGSRFEA